MSGRDDTLVLGIDKGTSVIKAVAFDATGAERACGKRRVPSLHLHPGWHEEDPDTTWRLTAEAIADALAALPAGSRVAAVGVTGHMGGAWLIDEHGAPVRNAICWPDGRAHAEQGAMERDGRLEELFAISGNASMPGMTLMALRWLERNEPESLERARTLLIAKDFIRHRLTGEAATEPSDVSWMPGDAETRGYSERLLEISELQRWRALLPEIVPSHEIAGRVTAQAAAQTGLPEGTPVVAGLGDGVANAVGTGVLHPGEAVTVMGTSCLNQLVVDGVEREPFGLGFLWTMPNGTRLRVLPNTAGTMSIDWMAQTTCPGLEIREVEALAAAQPPGAGGVIFLPYLNSGGVLAPFFDPLARGCLLGLTAQTSQGQLARATFEGLAFATGDCYGAMPRQVDRVRLTGGGANSGLLGQLVADVLGRPVERLTCEESGAAGVGMLAAVAAGLADDLDDAAARWCRVARTFEPVAASRERLTEAFALYRALRDAVRPLSAARHALSEVTTA
jgi:sugar (pentulose or hexulose) kinase